MSVTKRVVMLFLALLALFSRIQRGCAKETGHALLRVQPPDRGILSGKYKLDQAATTDHYAQGTVMGSRYRYVVCAPGALFFFYVLCAGGFVEACWLDTRSPRPFFLDVVMRNTANRRSGALMFSREE